MLQLHVPCPVNEVPFFLGQSEEVVVALLVVISCLQQGGDAVQGGDEALLGVVGAARDVELLELAALTAASSRRACSACTRQSISTDMARRTCNLSRI